MPKDQRVYRDVHEALRNRPHDEKDRFRLYEVRFAAAGEIRYVWERNPDMAIGRGARDMGVSAEVYNAELANLPPWLREVADIVGGMSPPDRERFIAAMKRTGHLGE